MRANSRVRPKKIALACQAPGTAWAFWYCDLRSRDLSLGERTHQIFVKRPRHSSKARYRSTFSSGNSVTRPKSKYRELWDGFERLGPRGRTVTPFNPLSVRQHAARQSYKVKQRRHPSRNVRHQVNNSEPKCTTFRLPVLLQHREH